MPVKAFALLVALGYWILLLRESQFTVESENEEIFASLVSLIEDAKMWIPASF